VVENTREAIAVISPEDRVFYTNHALEELFRTAATKLSSAYGI